MDKNIVFEPQLANILRKIQILDDKKEAFRTLHRIRLEEIRLKNIPFNMEYKYTDKHLEKGNCVWKECGLPTEYDKSFCLAHEEEKQCIVMRCHYPRYNKHKLYCRRHFQTTDNFEVIDHKYAKESKIYLRNPDDENFSYYSLGNLEVKDIFNYSLNMNKSFNNNFKIYDSYTYNLLSTFDMTDLCLAGGSIVSILFKKDVKDYDLFIITKDENKALESIRNLGKHIKEHDPKMFITRNDFTVTFNTKGKQIQIITRLYFNITQVISGFDIDSCCVAWNGKELYAMPRFTRSIEKGYNIVDYERQSQNYHTRLYKYFDKYGFAMVFPGYVPERVNPDLINKTNLTGLAKVIKFAFDKIRGKSSRYINKEESISDYDPDQIIANSTYENSLARLFFTSIKQNIINIKENRDVLNIIDPSYYNFYTNKYILEHFYNGVNDVYLGENRNVPFDNLDNKIFQDYEGKYIVRSDLLRNEQYTYKKIILDPNFTINSVVYDQSLFSFSYHNKRLSNYLNQLMAKVIVYTKYYPLKLKYLVSMDMENIINGFVEIPQDKLDFKIYSFMNIIKPSPLKFIICNPGSQITGSFFPTSDNWYEDLYRI
jgi:hypothetical protein